MMDYTMIAAVVTTGIALVMTGVGLKYRGQYQAAMVVVEHSALFIGGVSEVVATATKALADDTLTPEEIADINTRLAKVLEYLKELQTLLGR